MLVLPMVDIYEVRGVDWLSCRYVCAKFHKDWLRHSKFSGEAHVKIETHRQQGDLISLLLFFKNKKNGLNIILENSL
jgi:hypothetical protein